MNTSVLFVLCWVSLFPPTDTARRYDHASQISLGGNTSNDNRRQKQKRALIHPKPNEERIFANGGISPAQTEELSLDNQIYAYHIGIPYA